MAHLVTGAAGFIGSHLAHTLHAEGHELILCDFLPGVEKARNLTGIDPAAFFSPEYLWAQRPSLPPLSSPIEAIWHLGADSDTTTRDWDGLLRTNVRASQTLWRYCAEQGIPFYYASSAATYGDGSVGFSDRTPPAELAPLNLYGRSKNEFDAWVLAEIEAGRPAPPHWAGFKFFNVYGAREGHKGRMASILWKAARDMEAHGAVRLFRSNDPAIPDGEQRRDFVWVGEALAHMRWVARARPASAIYNSGTGHASTFLEMIHAWFAARGREPSIEFVPMPEALTRQYQNYTRADMSKLREAGYDGEPVLPEEGVRRTLEELGELRVEALGVKARGVEALGAEPATGAGEEAVEILHEAPRLRIERIVSRGHASPEGFWYDQDEEEWVMVLEGRARLVLRDPDESVELGPGDHLRIAAHRRHRVAWTDPERPTVWLAVFFGGD